MKTSLQWELWAVIRTVLTAFPPLFRSFTTSSLNGLFIIAPAHWSVKVIWLESSSFSWINTEDRWNLYGYASLQIRFPCYFKHVFIYIVDLNALNACKNVTYIKSDLHFQSSRLSTVSLCNWWNKFRDNVLNMPKSVIHKFLSFSNSLNLHQQTSGN